MPKVSVIVPVYGVEKYIERCARSLFEQTLDDIEYLFIDDCTPDRSIEILQQVLEKYPQRKPQVVIHRMEKNSGQAAVRKWGMQNVTGEYVIHCDSDDWVDTDMHRAMYEKAKVDGADVVVCDFKVTDGERFVINSGICHEATFLSDMMYSKYTWALWNKLIKRSLHKEIEYPSENVGEDMAMVIQMVIKARKISCVKGTYYYYYYNPMSVMNRQDKDSLLCKYRQMNSNINYVEEALRNSGLIKTYTKELNAIKFYGQTLLIPVLDEQLLNEWEKRNNFSYISILVNPKVKIRYKMRYVLYKTKLYNLVMRMR